MAHPAIVGIRVACLENARRLYVRCLLVGVLAFLAVSAFVVVLIPVEHQYWILLGFIPIVVSALIGERYHRQEMRPYEKSLKFEPYECHHCGIRIPRESLSEHFKSKHKRIYCWMTASSYLLLGIPAAIALLSAYSFWKYLSWPILDALYWSLAPGLAALVIWATVVEYIVMPRIEARGNE